MFTNAPDVRNQGKWLETSGAACP